MLSVLRLSCENTEQKHTASKSHFLSLSLSLSRSLSLSLVWVCIMCNICEYLAMWATKGANLPVKNEWPETPKEKPVHGNEVNENTEKANEKVRDQIKTFI